MLISYEALKAQVFCSNLFCVGFYTKEFVPILSCYFSDISAPISGCLETLRERQSICSTLSNMCKELYLVQIQISLIKKKTHHDINNIYT